jgi:Predicted membrane protein
MKNNCATNSRFGFGAFFGLVCLFSLMIGSANAIELAQMSFYQRIEIVSSSNRIFLEPGNRYQGFFKVVNNGQEGFQFKVYAKPYSVSDEGYTPVYTESTSRAKIASWIKFGQISYYLDAGESINIGYSVDVPKDVESGGQYATIFAETETSVARLIPRQARLVLYARTISGTYEDGELVSTEIKSFVSNGSAQASSLIENTGNVDFESKHSIKVQTLFGEDIYNDTKSFHILPGTKRLVNMEWTDGSTFGIYRVLHEVSTLNNTYNEAKIVFLVPYSVITSLVIGVASVVVLISVFKLIGRRKSKIRLKP